MFSRILDTMFTISCASIVILFSLPLIADEAAIPLPPLDWMAGHWCVDMGGNTTEELWLPPHGGMMLGLGRTWNSERTGGFEYLRIVERDGIQSYVAQPGGGPPTSFKRTAGGEHWVRFENPDHDFPQRIEYRRDAGNLRAEVAGPDKDGQEVVISFDYNPCSSQSPSDDG